MYERKRLRDATRKEKKLNEQFERGESELNKNEEKIKKNHWRKNGTEKIENKMKNIEKDKR